MPPNDQTSRERNSRRFFGTGLLGGAFAIIATYLGTTIMGIPFPPEEIYQLLISPVQGSVESILVETFRDYAKYSAFAISIILYDLLYGILSVPLGKLLARSRSQLIVAAVILMSLIGLGLEFMLNARSSFLQSASGWMAAGILVVISNLAYAITLVQVSILGGTKITDSNRAIFQSSRRTFLKRMAILAGVIVLAGAAARVGLSLLSGHRVVGSQTPIPINSPPYVADLNGLPEVFKDSRIRDLVASEVSDNRVFYRVDIDTIPPSLDFDRWSLKVSGKVRNPLTIDKQTLLPLPTAEEYATLECVSNDINPPGGLISCALWTGVPLSTILDRADPAPNAKYVVFHCADGYTVGIPLTRATEPGALLAYKMDGELLPREHGYPLRAVIPGIYGMMNAKWVTQIELTDSVYLGYWQVRGWSNDARISTTSIIYYPPNQAQVNASIPIAGVAFAGERGISKVEVSVDGGNTWREATLKKPKSPYSWVLWAYQWNPEQKGTYTITARATDGQGQLQDQRSRPPFPDGATGYDMIHVTVA